MRALTGVLFAFLVACKPPPDALVSNCTTEMLAIGDPHSCTLRVERFTGEVASWFTTENRNKGVHVKARFELAKGEVRASLKHPDGSFTTVTVKPGAPQTIELDTQLELINHSFQLRIQPVGEGAEGLSGTLDYKSL